VYICIVKEFELVFPQPAWKHRVVMLDSESYLSFFSRGCVSPRIATEEAYMEHFKWRSEEAFRRFSVPVTFISFVRMGFSTESATLASAASCMPLHLHGLWSSLF